MILRRTTLCLTAALAFESTSAFTIAPPTSIDAPLVSESSLASRVQTSPSNLPSQSQLLEKVGSLTISAATVDTKVAPVKASPAPAPAKSTPSPAKAASKAAISIAEINFDGKVAYTEADEYVVIQNTSKDTIDVSGYIIYPATTGTQGSTFSFPKGSTIKPNSSVRIYTNEIHKETGGYSWGSGKALWSNKGGLAVLKDNKGTKLGEFKYTPVAKKS